MRRCTRDHQVGTAADPVLGLPWSKRSSGMGKISTAGVPSATFGTGSSAPRHKCCVTRQSVRRSAQDDGFVGVSTKNILKLALMGFHPGLSSAVPSGLDLLDPVFSRPFGTVRVFRQPVRPVPFKTRVQMVSIAASSRKPQGVTIPLRIAYLTNSETDFNPSLLLIFTRWLSTVLGLICKLAATSLLPLPSASN